MSCLTGVLQKIQHGMVKKNNNLTPVRLWINFHSKRVGIKPQCSFEVYCKKKNIPDTWTLID